MYQWDVNDECSKRTHLQGYTSGKSTSISHFGLSLAWPKPLRLPMTLSQMFEQSSRLKVLFSAHLERGHLLQGINSFHALVCPH